MGRKKPEGTVGIIGTRQNAGDSVRTLVLWGGRERA